MADIENLATYRRYLLKTTDLLAVRGNIAPVIAGMRAYNARHGIPQVKPCLGPAVREILAAVALAAVSLADRESWGWSLVFEGMRTGFFAGVEPEGMVCLRTLPANAGKASVMVQRQKAGLPLTQSHVEPRSESPADAVRRYFTLAAQAPTRLWVRDDGEGILAQSLPGGNLDAVEHLDAPAMVAFVDGEVEAGRVREAGEVLLFYECRCSEEMISRLVATMREPDRRRLFGDATRLEIQCPRCGREYTVARTETALDGA